MRRSLTLTFAVLLVTGTLFPLSATLAGHAPSPAPRHTPLSTALALAQRDQRALSAARPDARDLFDLTRRLRLHLRTPINPYVRTTTPDYAVGHKEAFWVSHATSGFYALHATLLLKTAHAYWYVQDKTGIPSAKLLALLKASAHDFEAHVYPTDRAAYGPEPPLGPDHDPRISILCATLPGIGGYYSAEDLYPRTVNAYSNQRKMLYVAIDSYALGTPDFNSTIAHEFQHMIHWYQHERDDTWINEGSSELAQVLNGYDPGGVDAIFASLPGTQVDNFCEPDSPCPNSDATYGASFQWMYYFYQHYGGDHALRAMLADHTLTGMALFDDVLARLHSHDSARDMFRKWVIANLVDDPHLGDGSYGYRPAYNGCCIHASLTTSTASYPYVRHASMSQYAADYVELRPQAGASTLHLRFSGDPTVRIVANNPVEDGMEWWSNRGDELDSTLTHPFDLSHVRHATLQYDVWTDIENGFDYGYVEVSRDGGRTWQTLRGRYTTNADPNAANYGNGYTGSSRKTPSNHDGWLHESIDLSAYAGTHILVRFEHITDDAFNLSGMTLDNIRIPEIGFVDQEGATGWDSHGWVRISNVLPTHWVVQLVLYTGRGVVVRQVPVAPDGTGTATITGLGADVQRAILVISPTAAQTTIASRYTVDVR